MTPRPGTVQTASSANSPRSAKPSLRENASKMLRTSASLAALDTRFLPAGDEPVDVPALGVGERDLREEAPRLGRVVVRDGRLEVLAERSGLPQLPAEPAKEADARLVGHACTLPRARRPSRLLVPVGLAGLVATVARLVRVLGFALR